MIASETPFPHEDSPDSGHLPPLARWAEPVSDTGSHPPRNSCPTDELVSPPPRIVDWETGEAMEKAWQESLETLDSSWEWATVETCWLRLMALDMEYFPGRLVPLLVESMENLPYLPVSLLEIFFWYMCLPHHRHHQGFHALLETALAGNRKLPVEKRQLLILAHQRLGHQLRQDAAAPPPDWPPRPPDITSGKTILHIEPEND